MRRLIAGLAVALTGCAPGESDEDRIAALRSEQSAIGAEIERLTADRARLFRDEDIAMFSRQLDSLNARMIRGTDFDAIDRELDALAARRDSVLALVDAPENQAVIRALGDSLTALRDQLAFMDREVRRILDTP
ncbi:MAG: hypothetical protein WEG36_12195 [Gemmatimonadota bacterium]